MTQQTREPLTSTEAIRRAITALGPEGEVPAIITYVREQYGIGGPEEFLGAAPATDEVACALPAHRAEAPPAPTSHPAPPAPEGEAAPRKPARKGASRKD